MQYIWKIYTYSQSCMAIMVKLLVKLSTRLYSVRLFDCCYRAYYSNWDLCQISLMCGAGIVNWGIALLWLPKESINYAVRLKLTKNEVFHKREEKTTKPFSKMMFPSRWQKTANYRYFQVYSRPRSMLQETESTSSPTQDFLHVLSWNYSDMWRLPSLWQDLMSNMHITVAFPCLLFVSLAIYSAKVYQTLCDTAHPAANPYVGSTVRQRSQTVPATDARCDSVASRCQDVPCEQCKIQYDVAMDSGRQKLIRKLRGVLHL